MKHKSLWIILGLTVAVLAPMTTFNVLDTFYFKHARGKYIINNDEFDIPTGEEETKVEYVTGTYNVKGFDATYHLLKIHVDSLFRLKSRLATDASGNYGINIQQSLGEIILDAKEESGKSVLGAITGDYCFWSSSRRGYVVRNGVIYRNNIKSKKSVDLVIAKKKDKDGSFISLRKESEYQLDGNVGEPSNEFYQIVSFGPALMENGEILVTEDAEINGNTWVNNPRAAFGWVNNHEFMFLATEARQRQAKDLKSFRLYDLATFLKEQGCVGAYNFDGGYSSGMAYNDEVVFKPGRTIGDIFYIE